MSSCLGQGQKSEIEARVQSVIVEYKLGVIQETSVQTGEAGSNKYTTT
jgi:hypothetical protein